MSSDLAIELRKPVAIEELALSSAKVVAAMLGMAEPPDIGLSEMSDGVVSPVTRQVIGDTDDDPMVLFEVNADGARGIVGIATYTVPDVAPYTAADDVGLWVAITVAATRSPLEFALAAGVAVALSRMVTAPIVDEACLWTPVVRQSPDNFARAVTIRQSYRDIATAARSFYDALPVSQPRELPSTNQE